MSEFTREDRYLVFKRKELKTLGTIERDYLDTLSRKLQEAREIQNKPPLFCLVIESDWDCYEAAWKLVEEEAKTKAPKQAFLLAVRHERLESLAAEEEAFYYSNYSILKSTTEEKAILAYNKLTYYDTGVIIAKKEGNNFKILDKTIPVPFEWLEKLTQTELD